ncbi:MAG: ketopantoate reductase family protein [Thermodesulfobacteriota bacterium]|nr:ketopantoate reductase family protein [Thermodesulfobacteriota bacterium]
MKYLVMGAGAMGSIFGGLLMESGHDVTFVGLDEHLKTIQEKGLKIDGIWGEHFLETPKAFLGTDGITGTFDVILVSVKSYHTASVMESLPGFMKDDTLVVSIQNGLGNWETIAGVLGWDKTIGARIIFGAAIPEPGTARVTVYADKVLLGSPSGAVPMEKLEMISRDFVAAGIPTGISTEIAAHLWGKVLYNCCLNPLGAILNVPYGDLCNTMEIKGIIRGIIQEIFSVARAKGITLLYAGPDDYYRFLLEEQLPPTASHRSSMLQDLDMGRPTEINALNGAICAYGRQYGVPTKINSTITAIIMGLEFRD